MRASLPARLLLLCALILTAACDDGGSGSNPTATPTAVPTHTATLPPTGTPTATASPTATPLPLLIAHESVEQLFITDAVPGTALIVLGPDSTELAQGEADAEGVAVFRELTPGEGYRIRATLGSRSQTYGPLRVMAIDAPPGASFYSQQVIPPGYGYLTTRDGTTLSINVVLPGPVEDGPYPTLVEYSGYDPANPALTQPGVRLGQLLGYAVVGVNMRGTGCSGGSFKFFEPIQSSDGYDAIEAIAAQPWVKFNKVGMIGISYSGNTQMYVARLRPPSLAAIAPLSVSGDIGRGIAYPGGVLNNGFALEWITQRQNDAQPFGEDWTKVKRDEGDQVCIENQRMRGQNPDLVQLLYDTPFYVPSIGDPIAPRKFVDQIEVPVFLTSSWQDEQSSNYAPVMLGNFTGTTKKHFVLTNGEHIDPLATTAIFSRWMEFFDLYVARRIPKRAFEATSALQLLAQNVFGVPGLRLEPERYSGITTYEAALAKWESEPPVRVLFDNGAGLPNNPGAPVATFEHSFESWPIPATAATNFYLGDNGALTANAPTGDGADSYRYDPSRAQLYTYNGPDIWKASEQANFDWPTPQTGKALVYETEPLTGPTVMVGSASADLWLKSTASDTDLQVSISEVRPDGKETFVQVGWLRASHRKLDEAASTVLRPEHTHLEVDAQPLPAGEFVPVRVEIYPFGHAFRTGSRIRVIIDAPGATRPAWKFVDLPADGDEINTIAHSAEMPSKIVLPIIPGLTIPTAYPPCPGLRNQPCRTYEPFANGLVE